MGNLLRNLGEYSYARGLCMEEGSETGVSRYRGLVVGHGEGDPSAGNYERWDVSF